MSAYAALTKDFSQGREAASLGSWASLVQSQHAGNGECCNCTESALSLEIGSCAVLIGEPREQFECADGGFAHGLASYNRAKRAVRVVPAISRGHVSSLARLGPHQREKVKL